MVERILALHRTDLPVACQLADQLQADGRPRPLVSVLDPVLQHHAQNLGLQDVRLLPLPDANIAVGVGARALAATRLVVHAVDDALAGFIPQARGAGWLGTWLRHLHFTVFGQRGVAALLAQRSRDEPFNLLLPNLPQRYGFHSFLPGLTIHAGMRAAGLSAQLYRHTLPPWDAPLLPDPCVGADGRPTGPAQLLCHLPTVFYDHLLLAEEIRASGRPALLLPSQYYDVEAPGLQRCTMVSPADLAGRLPGAQRQALSALADRLGAVLSRELAHLIASPALLQAQVQAMVDSCSASALLFWALEERFGRHPAQRLLITDHDTGQNGALISHARAHTLPLRVVPHAKTFNQTMHGGGPDMLCLTHGAQGGLITDADGNRLPTATLDLGDPLALGRRQVRPLRVLALVLNSVVNSAMCLVSIRHYLQGIREIRDWCQAHGVTLRMRCRPNASLANLLAAELDLPAADLLAGQSGSVAEFAAGSDLVVGYDLPTSGALEMLQHGLPMLQALIRPLSPEEWRIIDPDLVPQLPLAEVLQRLHALHADPVLLWRFGQQQTCDYLAAMRTAQPLRSFL
jgi:hypothetical protein